MNIKNNHLIESDFILFQHNIHKDTINDCLDIVSEYIVNNELLIVGGMSIDFALKLKNSYLYDENYDIPDYDIISPDNVKHANQIGEILCNFIKDKKGQTVNIIPAIHKTTVRVQILGYTLFDSTFIPEYIYQNIPHSIYNKNGKDFHFIDPIYQKIDQFSSLSFLWEKTGKSFNIENRFIKDIIRKNKLSEFYNLEIIKYEGKYKDYKIKHMPDINNIKLINKKNGNITLQKNYTLQLLNENVYSLDIDILYHGIIAYCFYYNNFLQFIQYLNIDKGEMYNKTINNISIKTNIEYKNGYLHFQIPEKIKHVEIINANGNIDNAIKQFNNKNEIKKLSSKSTSIPNYVELDNIKIYDLYGKLLSINHTNLNKDIFFISNYNYLLSYFLFNYYHSKGEEKNIYGAYYTGLIEMVRYINYINIITTSSMEGKGNNIFYYSINNIGEDNYNENDFYFIKNFIHLINHNSNIPDILPPKNYIKYPNCDIKKKFEIENSEFYKKDQIEIENTNFKNELYELLNSFKLDK